MSLAAPPSGGTRVNRPAVFRGRFQQEMAACWWSHKCEVVFFLHPSIAHAEAFAGAIPKAEPKGDANAFGICVSLETGKAEYVSRCTISCLTGLEEGDGAVPRWQLSIFGPVMSCTVSLS